MFLLLLLFAAAAAVAVVVVPSMHEIYNLKQTMFLGYVLLQLFCIYNLCYM